MFITCLLVLPVLSALPVDNRAAAKVEFRDSRNPRQTQNRVACQTTPDTFPIPPSSLPILVERARVFAQTYFTTEELNDLRRRLDEARRLGANRSKIRQVVQDFVNQVLDDERKTMIRSKKTELDKQFGSEFV